MEKGFSRVCRVEQSECERTIYINDQYVCRMKLFPICHVEPPPNIGNYRRFHLRFYLPRETLSRTEMKINKLIIMTNGLDEIYDFDLYDELGSRLATRGIASVLLPIPDHLNRHTQFRIPKPSLRQVIQKPSDILMEEGIMLYERYLQFREELNALFSHIIGEKRDCTDNGCRFYRDLFAPDTRISLLGYSLGSAAMLSYFLERLEQHNDVNTCLLLSAAVTLRNTCPDRMFGREEWDDYVGRLEGAFLEVGQNYPEGTEEASRLFGAVSFAHHPTGLRNVLRKHGRRVLFLFGARDSVTGVDKLVDLEPRDWGLAKLVLPGINHFLAVDEEFKQWIDLIVNLIIDFERKGSLNTITLPAVKAAYDVSERLDEVDEVTRDQAETLIRRSKYLGLDPDVIPGASEEKIQARTIDYKRLKEALLLFAHEGERSDSEKEHKAAQFLSNKKFGHILYRLGLIKSEDLARAITLQGELKQNGMEKRVGEILVQDLKVLRSDQLDVLGSALDRAKECLVKRL